MKQKKSYYKNQTLYDFVDAGCGDMNISMPANTKEECLDSLNKLDDSIADWELLMELDSSKENINDCRCHIQQIKVEKRNIIAKMKAILAKTDTNISVGGTVLA